MSEHQHQWVMRAHIDGCHFYSSTYTCECGTRLETFDEREPMSDGWSGVWMDPECERCTALLKGATTEHVKEQIPA